MAASVAAALACCAAASGDAAARPTPLARAFCSALISGTAQPQVLIASDLPVRGFAFHEDTLHMEAAIRFVLERHRFKAGRFTVGYQACDDSNPQAAQGDLTKCAANAKAYAEDAGVVGVIGTWSSNCAAVEIPILGKAPDGPLGMISPSNTNVGLTHADAGTAPGEPTRYYPTGRRKRGARQSPPAHAQQIRAPHQLDPSARPSAILERPPVCLRAATRLRSCPLAARLGPTSRPGGER